MTPPSTWSGTVILALALNILGTAIYKGIEWALSRVSKKARERALVAATRREQRIEALMRSPSRRSLTAIVLLGMAAGALAALIVLGYTSPTLGSRLGLARGFDLAMNLLGLALFVALTALIVTGLRDLHRL